MCFSFIMYFITTLYCFKLLQPALDHQIPTEFLTIFWCIRKYEKQKYNPHFLLYKDRTVIVVITTYSVANLNAQNWIAVGIYNINIRENNRFSNQHEWVFFTSCIIEKKQTNFQIHNPKPPMCEIRDIGIYFYKSFGRMFFIVSQ